MLILSTALLLATSNPTSFPEQMPGLMEDCLVAATAAGDVTDTDESHKYICVGETAMRLWAFLERAEIESYEQDVAEGRWLSRDFPLGACFKRVRMPDGQAANTGLSCTIWVPRPTPDPSVSEP